ncbi:hypothetical protein ACFLU5_09405 [Bacteroidota bacterium]
MKKLTPAHSGEEILGPSTSYNYQRVVVRGTSFTIHWYLERRTIIYQDTLDAFLSLFYTLYKFSRVCCLG